MSSQLFVKRHDALVGHTSNTWRTRTVVAAVIGNSAWLAYMRLHRRRLVLLCHLPDHSELIASTSHVTPNGDLRMKRLLLAFAGAVLFATSAFAGPQYVDKTGFAISGYDVVAYRDLEPAGVGEVQPLAVPGNAAITAEHNGATWAFSSEENRARFLERPDYFVPAFDGHCAYGVAKGGKVPANPHLWRIVDDKLYLNITKVVVGFWEADIPGFITTGDSNWQSLAPKAAAKRKVPQFDIASAPVQ